MRVRAPSRRHWASRHWSLVLVLCLAGLTAVSMQVRCVDAAREAARLAARGDERFGDSSSPAASRPAGRASRCAATASSWWPRSSPTRSYCRASTLRPKRSRRWSHRDDRGSATVVAAAMVAVLLCVTAAGAYLGSVVVARHRAQAAADLAALAAAARLPSGARAACARATAVAREMRSATPGVRWTILMSSITVRVAVVFAGAARAAARAGPVDTRPSESLALARRNSRRRGSAVAIRPAGVAGAWRLRGARPVPPAARCSSQRPAGVEPVNDNRRGGTAPSSAARWASASPAGARAPRGPPRPRTLSCPGVGIRVAQHSGGLCGAYLGT